MPSPFPGMDPFLESELWTSFHASLATAIAFQLAPKIAPNYVALPTEHLYLDVPDDVAIETRDMYPDVAAVYQEKQKAGAAATALAPAPLRLATIMPEPIPHVNVEIRDVKKRRLVTAIEILSPTNKRGARKKYLKKRRALLLSSAHLLEIDLVRGGRRVPMKEPLPQVPYFVLLSRAERRPMTEVWPIELTSSRPEVPVPLLKKDGEVKLDLQAALTEVYDRGGYRFVIDYAQRPDVPLPPQMATWANKLLRAAKLRT